MPPTPNENRLSEDSRYINYIKESNNLITIYNKIFGDKQAIVQETVGELLTVEEDTNGVKFLKIDFEQYKKYRISVEHNKILRKNIVIYGNAIQILELEQKKADSKQAYQEQISNIKILKNKAEQSIKDNETSSKIPQLTASQIKTLLLQIINDKGKQNSSQSTSDDKDAISSLQNRIEQIAMYTVKQSIIKTIFNLYILFTNNESCSQSKDLISQISDLLKNIKARINNDTDQKNAFLPVSSELSKEVQEIHQDIDFIWSYISTLQKNISNTADVLSSSMSILQEIDVVNKHNHDTTLTNTNFHERPQEVKQEDLNDLLKVKPGLNGGSKTNKMKKK